MAETTAVTAPVAQLESFSLSKRDPQMQDQEDLVLSFLNTDYLADPDTNPNAIAVQFQESKYFTFDDKTWDFGLDVSLVTHDAPSPPWSETASSDSGLMASSDEASKDDASMDGVESGDGSPTLTPMDTDYWQFVNPDLVASAASNAAAGNASSPFDVSGAFDALTTFATPLPAALQFMNNGSLNSLPLHYPTLPLTPASPPSTGGSPSSSDTEQPKRKRGRKKRDGASSATSAAPVPLKPLMPILPQASVMLAGTADTIKPIKLEQLPPSPPLAPSTPVVVGKTQQTGANSTASSLKKRQSLAPAMTSPTTPSTATTTTATATTTSIQIKSEPSSQQQQSLPSIQQKTLILPAPPSTTSTTKLPTSSSKPATAQTPQDAAAQAHAAAQAAALAKRQERLIKNRAAALLSRKRKREHITLLEQHTEALSNENVDLKEQVEALEVEVNRLGTENGRLVDDNKRITRENEELRSRVARLEGAGRVVEVEIEKPHAPHVAVGAKNSRTTGVVFMIILFSFALFTLPTGNLNRLTVGGATTRPLIAPGASLLNRPVSPLREALLDASPRTPPPSNDQDKLFPQRELLDAAPSATATSILPASAARASDLVLLSEVQPKELQIWLSKGLERAAASPVGETGLIRQFHPVHDPVNPHAYLYCANLAHILPNDTVRPAASASASASADDDTLHKIVGRPRLSFLSPLSPRDHPPVAGFARKNRSGDDDTPQYLQIDVEVLSSRLVSANFVGLGARAASHASPPSSASIFANGVLRVPFVPAVQAWKVEEEDGDVDVDEEELVNVKQERMDEDIWPLGSANATTDAEGANVSGVMARKAKRRRIVEGEKEKERKERGARMLRPVDRV
ncbi:hypothetical protein BC936DRAFT_148309 [Jimgerdemannia flammicorona]|uniref:BZIP domain-containing protein n=1 Tax=Jimgerdemannia flammicorona TaxID=994334 RepID=A0A433D3B6_9FUNG|nr:hypothetical protein BC936DRAFT_148309 [Jimgerdemannia flammicorona]